MLFLFQFLIGSMKGMLELYNKLDEAIVSIPYRFNERLSFSSGGGVICLFQFLIGSMKVRAVIRGLLGSIVSIPYRFNERRDLDDSVRFSVVSIPYRFNESCR